MADEKEDYELMPHNEIQSLRDELRRLKENPASSDKTLQKSMENLTKVIGDLMTLFKDAEQSMKAESGEEKETAKKVDNVIARLKTLEDQNEKIAQAMVAIADMVEKNVSKQPAHAPPKPSPMPHPPAPSPFDEPKPPLPGAVPSLDDPFAAPPQFEGIPPPPAPKPMGGPLPMGARPPMGAPPMPPAKAPSTPHPPKKKFSLFKK